jgi:hypothetical protein
MERGALAPNSARFLYRAVFHACLAFGAFAGLMSHAGAQTNTSGNSNNPVLDGLLSSFAVPWQDLLTPRRETFLENLFDGFSGGFGMSQPLDMSKPAKGTGVGSQGARDGHTPTMTASLKYVPLGNWFASATFYRYLNRTRQASWNPDFSYVFGYDDWRPYTLSLVYANYGGNRISPDWDKGERHTRFREGTWSLGWKFPLPDWLAEPMLIDTEQSINCQVSYNVTPRFFDLKIGKTLTFKQTGGFGCKYPIWGNWYMSAAASWYPNTEDQQPWNPDFTYGFGYFDWHPGSISIQYNNYSGNRWPWRKPAKGTGRFSNGGISVNWSWVY